MPKFTVPRTDHSYTDAHGVTIHYYLWQSPKTHAVLQLTHGLGHSWGSLMVQDVLNKHADEYEAAILTGVPRTAPLRT